MLPGWTRSGALFALLLVGGFGLLTPAPAQGFLDVIDSLKEEHSGEKADPTAGLKELLKKLDDVIVPTFTDIPPNAWFTKYAMSVATWKIVEGYRDADGKRTGLFGPGDPVTVVQAVKMALRAAKVDEEKCTGDVRHAQAKGHWSEKFILCAENRNFRLFQGDSAPDLGRLATRAEVIGIIHDAFREIIPPLSAPFSDTVGHPYEADIAYANIQGVVSGDSDVRGRPLWRFRPNDPVTRAETAKMLYEQLRTVILNLETAESIVIDIATQDHSFSPKNIVVRKGQFVTLRFQNTGKHTFTIPGLEINKLLVYEEETVSFVPQKSGEFTFFCAVKGHQEKGMVGKIVVK